MGKLTKKMVEESAFRVQEAGLTNALKGKSVLVASTDAHVYGLQYVKSILESAGAKIVDAGVDSSVPYIFDTADEEGITCIGVSTHNGQALGIADRILKEMKKRDKPYIVFMGGRLNTILPGHSEPSDVQDMINKKGIFAENDLVRTIQMIQERVTPVGKG